MRNVIAVVLMSLAMASTAQALTFKKGEVLGSDGKLTAVRHLSRWNDSLNARSEDMPAGVVTGNNVFVVVGDEVSFVPVDELRGKTKDTQLQIIGDQVVQDMTGNENITFAQVEA